MEEKDIKEETAKEEHLKSQWQLQKENWYDRVPLNQKQLDIIIGVCLVLLVLTFVLIYLDAKDIFHLFGR
ncbi:MAG: hypothetical protein EGQ87_06665 [Clostridiales bacterium]|nr:hypothetical protein [Clostridiales bacterium]